MPKPAITVNRVSKTFKLPHEKFTSLKGLLINIIRMRKGYEIQHVLNEVSFTVEQGEFFGIVGRNGSGKSTLLKLLAGIYTPTKGDIEVNGKLTPFIELGVGFNPELTGRENVFLNGALLGFNRKEMAEMYNEIVDFAELERFMDQKLKNYSSGMQVRLAFSIAIKAESQILLIDEVLAVGDAAFQRKCYDYFQQLKDKKRTVVFISHDMGAIQTFCDRAMLIEKSRVVLIGHPQEAATQYNQILMPKSVREEHAKAGNLIHTGTGGVLIHRADILDKDGKIVNYISEGQLFRIRVHYTSSRTIDSPIFGIGIMGQNGQSIVGPNTRDSELTVDVLPKQGSFTATFANLPLSTGTYRIRASIMNKSVTIPYDFVESLATLVITGRKRYGDIYLQPTWTHDKE